MKTLPFLLCLLLSSCVAYDHYASSKSGNVEHDRLFSLGGTSSQRGADGSSFVHDHQQSLRDAGVAIAAGIGAVQAPVINGQNKAADIAKTPPTVVPGQVVQPAQVAPGETVFPLVTPTQVITPQIPKGLIK